MTSVPDLELRRLRDRLEPGDPIRSLVDLVTEDNSRELVAAVIRRLAAEIQAEKGGPRDASTPAGREAAGGNGQPRES